MNPKRLFLLAALPLGLCLAAASFAIAEEAELPAADLQGMLDGWRESHEVPGALLGVAFGDGTSLILTSGVASLDTQAPLRPDHGFRIGSITKTFVAAAVLQLAQEGRLSLDDPLGAHLPDFPHADVITVRQLLAHRSGVPEYEDLPGFYETVGADLSRTWTPQEVLELVTPHGFDFPPGSDYAYSSSNYLLLGLLVERVTGLQLAEALERRFFTPLGLTHTSFMRHGRNQGELATGYSRRYAHLFDAAQLDVRTVPLTAIETVSWASGAMISNAADLLTWGRALYGGALLNEATTRDMLSTDPAYGSYGLGVGRRETVAGPAFGHAGSFIGYLADVMYVPALDVTVVALANTDASDVNIEGVVESAIRLLAGESPEAYLARLEGELRATDPALRRAAAHELGRLGAQADDAVPTLVEALRHDPSAEVRREAALALGHAGRRQAAAVRALAAALEDEDWTVRRAAAFVLGFIGPQACVAAPELRRALQDERDEVRRAVVEALQQLGADQAPGPDAP